ncbi:dTDP-4-dehydrorhamnose reductase [Sulfuritortus calidifontis]|uniref:dTDP-4-dehydrorhamnose reductase n=1 Tax=Sulfuritortus calidifontis TaxID=1914471 RepID=UPI0018D59F31|nr:dTDP-4-dehydrorhamnose reductase [Sulfuritortus calidifontis]
MRILLTGVTGQVGWELQRSLACLGEVRAPGRQALDLTQPDSIRRAVRDWRPELIVNPAAHTAVDRAEAEPDLAAAINAVAPGILAEEAAKLGALLVHYSTDYVFDGGKATPYVEDDAANPQNVYGRTKLAGEEAVRANNPKHLILRTSWVYGRRGGNFLRTMQRLMRERPELRIVADQIGSPTWSRLIAEATGQMLAQCLGPNRRPGFVPWGTYHLTCAGATSWHGFAQAIAELDRIEPAPRLIPIPSADYPTPAKRPLNSRLSNARLAATFGLALPDWRRALELCLGE